MNKFQHIIYIPFTGVGKHQYKGDEWFKNRIEVFLNYTLKSLLNQSNKNFVVWLSFRKEDMYNPLVLKLADRLPMSLNIVWTFNGLLYHDDRNAEQNKTLEQRLERALKTIEHLPMARFVLLTRLDSDDMLHKDAVQRIQDAHTEYPAKQALCMNRGYIYNQEKDEVCLWHPETNPPFHTIVFRWDFFFDPVFHLGFYDGFKSHEDIVDIFDFMVLPDYLYCVFTHDPQMHISTSWDHRFNTKTKADKAVLKDFGL